MIGRRSNGCFREQARRLGRIEEPAVKIFRDLLNRRKRVDRNKLEQRCKRSRTRDVIGFLELRGFSEAAKVVREEYGE